LRALRKGNGRLRIVQLVFTSMAGTGESCTRPLFALLL
jgi:hypothetical protein